MLSPLWLVSEEAAVYALLALALIVLVDMLLLPAKWQIRAQRIVPANVGLGDNESAANIACRSAAVARSALCAVRLAPRVPSSRRSRVG